MAKGCEIVQDPYKAHYRLQTNVLHMGKEIKHLTIASVFGSGLVGSSFGGGFDKLGTMIIGEMIGSGLGMIAGAAIIDIWVLWMSM